MTEILVSSVMKRGWQAVLETVVPPETHPEIVKALKRAYYAGAQHVLDQIMEDAGLEESDTLTASDRNKVDSVMGELEYFWAQVAAERQ